MDNEALKKEIWTITYNLLQKIFNEMGEALTKTGLTQLQISILACIKEELVTTVGSLSKKLGINQGNSSSICKKLEVMGYIVRSRNAKDERIVNLILTEKGCRVLEEMDESVKKIMDPVFEALSEETMIVFLKGIKQIEENIGTFKDR